MRELLLFLLCLSLLLAIAVLLLSFGDSGITHDGRPSYLQRLASDPQNLFSVLLVCTAIAQVYLVFTSNKSASDSARSAMESAEIARKSLIQSQRAWIKVDLDPGNVISMDEHGVSTSISVRIRNVGNSPAIGVSTQLWMGINRQGGLFAHEMLKQKCDEFRAQRTIGFVLFPNESYPDESRIGSVSYGVNVPLVEVRNAISSNSVQNVGMAANAISLYIVGCVGYSFASDSEYQHQTRFIYEVSLNTPGFIKFSPGETIPREILRLHRSDSIDGQFSD